MVCPGVGFDVIPTDCVAAALKAALPDANRLALGFESDSTLSRGHREDHGRGSRRKAARFAKAGKIVDVPHAYRTRRIDFGNGEKPAMTIPGGTWRPRTTRPGSRTSKSSPRARASRAFGAKQIHSLRWLFGWAPVQGLLKAIAATAKGPNAEHLANQPTYVWGEVIECTRARRRPRASARPTAMP